MNRLRITKLSAIVAMSTALSAHCAQAAFIVEADNVPVAGKANANFSSLPPGTGFSLSTTPSFAVGLAGNQSIFGNPANANGPDQYTFRYTPGTDLDNTVFTPAQVLGNSEVVDADGLNAGLPTFTTVNQVSTNLVGGLSGYYNVYFTTPQTTGASATGSQFVITHDLGSTSLNPVSTNNGGTGPDTTAPGGGFIGGANDMWLKIASNVQLTAGTTYTVTQTANTAAFVSQRAHGVMWEYVGPIVPEPATLSLAVMGLVGMIAAGRRKS